MISSRIRAWIWCAALLMVAPGSAMVMQAQTAVPPVAAGQAVHRQFYLRLSFPRPTFAVDMTPAEHALMVQHRDYWMELFKSGKVLLGGPVNDPKGVFGFIVVECTEAEAQAMADGDPSVKSGMNRFEVMPMEVVIRKTSQ